MGWKFFGGQYKKEVEPVEDPIPAEDEVQETETTERLKNLEARKEEMALQIVDALIEPTESLRIEWRVEDEDRTAYPTYKAFIGGFGSGYVEITDHATYYEVVLRETGRGGIAILRETFHHHYRGGNEDYHRVQNLVAAIRRQPDFLEDAFQRAMDYIQGREWDEPEEQQAEEEQDGDV
jgi:hypothetical protein